MSGFFFVWGCGLPVLMKIVTKIISKIMTKIISKILINLRATGIIRAEREEGTCRAINRHSPSAARCSHWL